MEKRYELRGIELRGVKTRSKVPALAKRICHQQLSIRESFAEMKKHSWLMGKQPRAGFVALNKQTK